MKLFPAAAIVAALAGVQFSGSAVAQNLCVKLANTPLTQPQPLKIEGATSYVYKSVNGIDLRLHVFGPSAPPPQSEKRAGVVFFFGGGWMIGTVTQFAPAAAYFAGRGMTAFVVDYRTFCRHGANIVDEVADAKSAVRWIRSHADQFGIDPHRIAVSGGSSGGHLALSTAMFGELDAKREDKSVSSRPDLLVLFYPCVDETSEEEKPYVEAIGSNGREVSPLYHIRPGLPATIIFQGTADSLYRENDTYCSEARKQGNDCEFVEYPEAPHGFLNRAVANGAWYEKGLRGMDDFLVRKGYLTPSTSPSPRS